MLQENIERLNRIHKGDDLQIELVNYKDNQVIEQGIVSHVNRRGFIIEGVIIPFSKVNELKIDSRYITQQDKVIIHLHNTGNPALSEVEELLGITYEGLKSIFNL